MQILILQLLTSLQEKVPIEKVACTVLTRNPVKVTNVFENMTDNCREIKKVARFKGTLVFTDVGGRQRLSGTIHRPRKSKLLPEMVAKERKMGLAKAAASFKCTALQCFRYTFHNGCCCRENQAYEGFVRNNRLFRTPWHSL